MKKQLLTLAAIVTVSVSFSQEYLDNSGNPQTTENTIKVEKLSFQEKSNHHAAVIINVVPSPIQSTYIQDLAFDGQYLWVEGYNEYFLRQISIVDGSVINSIPTSVDRAYGLTYGDNHLWLADNDNKLIQKIDPTNGNVIQSFPTPADPAQSYPSGLAWDGTSLWHNDTKGGSVSTPDDSTFKLTPSGAILQAYQAKGDYPSGLAYDGQYLWTTDNGAIEIYKVDPVTFVVLDTIDAPGGAYPNGLAFDGQYLWVSNNDTDSIYQIDIGFSDLGVSTSELDAFTIYPNPTNDHITISSDQLDIKEINIISISGEIIESFKGTTKIITVSNFPNGVYIVQLITADGEMNKQFIKE